MIELKNQEFIIDEKGNRKKIILDYKYYLKLLEKLEDNEDSKLIKLKKKKEFLWKIIND